VLGDRVLMLPVEADVKQGREREAGRFMGCSSSLSQRTTNVEPRIYLQGAPSNINDNAYRSQSPVQVPMAA